ncbi:hypothetical protein [Actinocrispum sp. NPDC049592]
MMDALSLPVGRPDQRLMNRSGSNRTFAVRWGGSTWDRIQER